jgi:hypothetical protein
MPGTVIALVVIAVLALAVIVVAPWRGVRKDGRLPLDVETELLLGREPDLDEEPDDGGDAIARPLPFTPRNS